MRRKLFALLMLVTMVSALWTMPVLAAQWKQETPMPTARVRPMPVVINGKIYVFGGLASTFPVPMPTNLTTVEIYDPATGRWTTGASIPTKTYCGDAAVNGKEKYMQHKKIAMDYLFLIL